MTMEPTREVSDPARFWGLAQAISEGWTKYRMQPDVKSTSHQDKGTPAKETRKGEQTGDPVGTRMIKCKLDQECRVTERVLRNTNWH